MTRIQTLNLTLVQYQFHEICVMLIGSLTLITSLVLSLKDETFFDT